MVSPLDLPGPQFLGFYVAFGTLVLILLYIVRSASEGGTPPKIDTSDPYLIAYLRGGKNEAARVATVSLIDRGLLKEKGTTLVATDAAKAARRPIEKAVVTIFRHPEEATRIFTETSIEAACEDYHNTSRGSGRCPIRGCGARVTCSSRERS